MLCLLTGCASYPCSRDVHGQGHVLVETKSASRDSTIDRMLRCLGARPIEMSKYTLAIGVFYPAIPANPWHRALRPYVG